MKKKKIRKRIFGLLFGTIILFGLCIGICGVLWLNREPLYPYSNLSDVPNAAALEALLESELLLGITSREDIDAFIHVNYLSMCRRGETITRCWTSAPSEYHNSGDLLRDIGNYLVLHWSYEIEFGFQDDKLANIHVSTFAIGP